MTQSPEEAAREYVTLLYQLTDLRTTLERKRGIEAEIAALITAREKAATEKERKRCAEIATDYACSNFLGGFEFAVAKTIAAAILKGDDT